MATPSKAWFKIINPESRWSKVTLEGIEDVDDLKQVIKKRAAPELDTYSIAKLIIKAKKEKNDPDNDAKELNEMAELASALKEYGTFLLVYVPSVRYVSTQPLSYPVDSDEGPDSMVIISPDRMKFIEQYMTDHRFVLIRSPPYSGKSTLRQWIRDSLISQGHKAYYISFAGI
ncbi:hypothetical protein BGX38DRAFT_1142993 [Terfezia claveryi]|nr:hypothetical protein BGX38DRAFT_1142993 [Terfezia claveryi]